MRTITEPCSNREFPREKQRNCHFLKIFVFLHGLMTWRGHAKKCVERNCELANKTTQQLCKVSTPCIDDHHFKEEEMKPVGELSQVCSVNKLVRSVTKWTKACDKRLNRLISYIHHTCEYRQQCHVGNTAKQCRLGLFQDSDFAGDLEDSKSTSGGTLCSWKSYICSNKLDVQETNCRFAQFNRS